MPVIRQYSIQCNTYYNCHCIDDRDCNISFVILTGKLSEEPDLRNKLMAASSEDGRGAVFNPEKRSNVVFPRAVPVVCNDGLILL